MIFDLYENAFARAKQYERIKSTTIKLETELNLLNIFNDTKMSNSMKEKKLKKKPVEIL